MNYSNKDIQSITTPVLMWLSIFYLAFVLLIWFILPYYRIFIDILIETPILYSLLGFIGYIYVLLRLVSINKD